MAHRPARQLSGLPTRRAPVTDGAALNAAGAPARTWPTAAVLPSSVNHSFPSEAGTTNAGSLPASSPAQSRLSTLGQFMRTTIAPIDARPKPQSSISEITAVAFARQPFIMRIL